MDHPEFLALLDAVHARRVLGMDEKDLFPRDPDERNRVVDQGKASLQRRGALSGASQGELTLTPAFEALARTIAYPEVAIIIVREVISVGPQLFLHYTARGGAVEHTFPREKVHRLAVLPDIPTMIEREGFILSLEEKPITDAAVEIGEDDFRAVRELARQQQRERVEAILAQQGARAAEAAHLFLALASPTFSGSVAILRCGQEAVIDARSLFVLQGPDSAWRATQKVPGVPMLLIQSTNASDIKNQVRQYFEELSRPA